MSLKSVSVTAVIQYTCIKSYKSSVFIRTILQPVGMKRMLPELPGICWSLCSVLYPAARLITTWGFYYLLFIPPLPSGCSGSAYSINFPQLNDFSGIQWLVLCVCHAKYYQVRCFPEPVRWWMYQTHLLISGNYSSQRNVLWRDPSKNPSSMSFRGKGKIWKQLSHTSEYGVLQRGDSRVICSNWS